jgi:hypothetical protein
MLHEREEVHGGFRYDAHPMGIFLSTVGALSRSIDATKIFDRSRAPGTRG